MCEISIDVLAMMYIVGGTMLGWFGGKSWKHYKKRSKNSDTKPTSTDNGESLIT